MITRLKLIALLPLLAMDCVANMLVGGSPRKTLSGAAWHAREHKWWGWTHRFIDWLFFWQDEHCKGAALREMAYGSTWKAWGATWRAVGARYPKL